MKRRAIKRFASMLMAIAVFLQTPVVCNVPVHAESAVITEPEVTVYTELASDHIYQAPCRVGISTSPQALSYSVTSPQAFIMAAADADFIATPSQMVLTSGQSGTISTNLQYDAWNFTSVFLNAELIEGTKTRPEGFRIGLEPLSDNWNPVKITGVAGGIFKVYVTLGAWYGEEFDSTPCMVTVNKEVTNIIVTPAAKQMDVNETFSISSEVVPFDEWPKTDINWTTSNSNAATVSNTGVVTAKGPGTAVITATTTLCSKSGTCTVTVTDPSKVTGISFSPASVDIAFGGSQTLTPIITPSTAANKNVTWSSNDTGVATVDANGLVKAVDEGTCVITAKTVDGGFSAGCSVKVLEDPSKVKSITLTPDQVTIDYGAVHQLTATVQPITAADKTILWSTGNANVATVNSNGLVSAVAGGNCYIYAQSQDGGFTKSCHITVLPKIPVTEISVSPNVKTLLKGETQVLAVSFVPSNAHIKTYSWVVTGDPDIATIDTSTGTVTGVGNGTTTFTAKADDGGYTAVATITVRTAVTGITISENTKVLPLGESFAIAAAVTPPDASNKNIVWTSSNSSIAAVTADGVVTGMDIGRAIITAKTEDGSYTAVCEIDVYIPVTGITIAQGTYVLPINSTEVIRADVAPEEATNKKILWSSSDTGIATVDANGAVTGHGAGSVIITAVTEESGFADSCVVKVVIPVTGVSIDKAEYLLPISTTMSITAHILPEDATNQKIHWSSGTPSIASVDEYGTVSGNSLGRAVITAASDDGGFTDFCAVYVITPVTGISIAESTVKLPHYESMALTAAVSPQDATNQKIHWISSDPLTASVDENGVVTGVRPGEAVITATSDYGFFTDTCLVQVVTPVTDVILAEKNIDLFIYRSVQLMAVIEPSHATNRRLYWSSSNPQVASVSEDGIVTAKKEGVTIVTVTTDDGGFTDTCTVAVKIPVDGIYMAEQSKLIPLGETYTLKAVIYPTDASNQQILWSSSNPDTAAVDENGTVTGHRLGEAIITATSEEDGSTDTCAVRIVIPVTGVSLEQPNLLPLGGKTALKATITPKEATNQKLHWASGDPGIAYVDENGEVTGLSVGQSVITVTTDDGSYVQQCVIHVVIHATGITLSANIRSIYVNDRFTLSPNILPGNATNKTVHWSSDDTDTATVDRNGEVTGHKAGLAVITATTDDGAYTASCEVNVDNRLVSFMSLQPDAMFLKVWERDAFTCTYEPESATNAQIYWLSSNPDAAWVGYFSGEVYAQANGRAVITAYANDGSMSFVKGTVDITTQVQRLDITQKEITICILEDYRLVTEFTPATSSDKRIEWTSSDTDIVSVDQWGVVRGIAAGEAYITAISHDGGHVSSCHVEVMGVIKPTALNVIPSQLTLQADTRYMLTPVLTPVNAENPGIIWYSSDAEVADVDPATGIVTAVSSGIALITAETADGELWAESEIEVFDILSKPEIIDILLINGSTEANLNIITGQSTELDITWLPPEVKEEITGDTAGPGVAELSGKTVTGVSPGSTDITFVTENGVQAVCHVKVCKPDIQAIYINGYTQYEKELTAGEPYKPNITTNPKEAADFVYCKSADPNTASVFGDTIIGVSPGETDIIFYTPNGVQAVCHVTVRSQEPFMITATSYGCGTLSPEGITQVKRGDKQVYTITPDEGYKIKAILVDNRFISSPLETFHSYTFQDIASHHTIEAYFEETPVYYVMDAHASGNGTIKPSGEFTIMKGWYQTFTITPDTDYQIDYLLIDGRYHAVSENDKRGMQYRFEDINGNHSITPVFSKIMSVWADNGVYSNANTGGICVADPVDVVTGSFTWEYRDLYVGGRHQLHFTRYYQNIDELSGTLGKGFSHSFDYNLKMDGEKAFFSTPSGDAVPFTYDSETGTYINTAEKHGEYTLEVLDGGGYAVYHRGGSAYYFNSGRKIFEVQQDGVIQYRYSYSGDNVSRVTGQYGAYFDFEYDSAGRIIKVSDFSGNFVTFTYGENGCLKSSKNADDDSMLFEYDENGNLIGITDFDNNKFLLNTYDSDKRVVQQYVSGRGVSFITYDTAQRVTTYTDAGGNTVKYFYDEQQNVTRVEDSAGVTETKYSKESRVTEQTDRLGNITRYEYDSAGRLVKTTNPEGGVKRTEYNSAGMPEKDILEDGTEISYAYNDMGRLTKLTDQAGTATSFTYDEYGNVTSLFTGEGGLTVFRYDEDGFLQKMIDPEGGETLYEYDKIGRLLSTTGPEGGKESYAYTTAGKLKSITDEDGNVKTFTSNGNGLYTEETDFLGNVQKTAYDEMGKPIAKTDYEGNTTAYSYDSLGNLIKVTDPLGYETVFEYDAMGNLITTADNNGGTGRLDYDAESRLINVTDPTGAAMSFTYDTMGRVTRVDTPGGGSVSAEYDVMGRVTAETNALGFTKAYTYDTRGNVISQTDYNGSTTYYGYDKENRLVSITTADNQTTALNYDLNGRLYSIKLPTEDTVRTSYNGDGNITETADAAGSMTYFTYNKRGLLEKKTTPDGGETAYEYDANGRLIRMTNPDGGAYGYAYDKNGQLTGISLPDGGTVANEYNARGELARQTDAAGNITSWKYDGNGNVIEETDPMGNVTHYTHDAANRVVEVCTSLGTALYEYDIAGNIVKVTENGEESLYEYDILNRLIHYTDARGNITGCAYDRNGNVISQSNPDGGLIRYGYDVMNRLVSVTDAEDNDTFYTYDILGRLSNVTDPNGSSTVYYYDAAGNMVKRVNAENGVLEISYDSMNRPETVTDEEGAVTAYAYDPMGNVTRVEDALGHSRVFEYDALGRVIRQENENGGISYFEYDPNGNVSKYTDESGAEYVYTYDAMGNTLTETDPAGNITAYTYDSLGRPLTKTDALGGVTEFTYNKQGRIETVTDGNGSTTTYTYDGNGNIIKITDALGAQTYFEYDDMNRLTGVLNLDSDKPVKVYRYDKRGLVTEEINAEGISKTYGYDANGNLITQTDGDGYITTYTFNSMNLITGIGYSDSKQVRYTYNKRGELVEMEDWNGVTRLQYDVLGRLKEATDHNNKTTQYEYDPVGNQTAIIYPDGGKVSYGYDALNRITKVTDTEGGVTGYIHGITGNLESMLYPNGERTEYEYDAAGNKTIVTETANGAVRRAYEYAYDALGNVITEITTGALNGAEDNTPAVKSYAYDALNRLVKAEDGTSLHSYVYDALGNLINETGTGTGGTDYVYDSLNRLISKTNETVLYTYAYDNRGNLTDETLNGEAIKSYFYDTSNRMAKAVNLETGEESGYVYNGLGYRIRTEQEYVTDYIIDYTSPLSRDLMAYRNDGQVTRNTYGLDKISQTLYPAAPEAKPVTAYFHQDRRGSTAYVTDETGRVVAYNEYSAWGEVIASVTVDPDYLWLGNTASYTGHTYDTVLEKYFAQYRLYDPVNKRFTAEDTYIYTGNGDISQKDLKPVTPSPGLDVNLYLYCYNNPITYFDPTGHATAIRQYYESRGYEVVWIDGPAGQRKIEIRNPGSKYASIVHVENDFNIVGSTAYTDKIYEMPNLKTSTPSYPNSNGSNGNSGGGTNNGMNGGNTSSSNSGYPYPDRQINYAKSYDEIIKELSDAFYQFNNCAGANNNAIPVAYIFPIIVPGNDDYYVSDSLGGILGGGRTSSGPFWAAAFKPLSDYIYYTIDNLKFAGQMIDSYARGKLDELKNEVDSVVREMENGNIIGLMPIINSGKIVSLVPIYKDIVGDVNEGAGDGSVTSAQRYPDLTGNPGEVKKDGYKETKIGPDGRATKQRHNTDHGNPKHHTNPHDHDIEWKPDGSPDFGKQTNYLNGSAPPFN